MSAAAKTYDLFFVLKDKRFFWKNPNHGVTITDAGKQSSLSWENEGRPDSALWTDIYSVSMLAVSVGNNPVKQCVIAFRDGRTLTATDGNASGLVDPDRATPYRDFIRDLHKRLAQAPAGTIVFRAGYSEGRHKALTVLIVIMALIFVGIPIGLFFVVHEWQVLWILLGGATFVWPLWRLMQANRPRDYDPRYPPGELTD